MDMVLADLNPMLVKADEESDSNDGDIPYLYDGDTDTLHYLYRGKAEKLSRALSVYARLKVMAGLYDGVLYTKEMTIEKFCEYHNIKPE